MNVCVCPYECATAGGCACVCHGAWRPSAQIDRLDSHGDDVSMLGGIHNASSPVRENGTAAKHAGREQGNTFSVNNGARA